MDILLCLRYGYAKILRERVFAHTVEYAEVDSLCSLAKLGSNLLGRHLEDSRGGHRVYILTRKEGVYHILVARDMRENSQLYLRVIGIDKHVILALRNEIFSEYSAKLGADGNVLQIRLGGRKSAGRRTGLIEHAMHSSLPVCRLGKTVGVGGLELCDLSVVENILDYGVIGRKLLESFSIGGITGLGLSRFREIHLLKQHLAELLWRADVEFLARVGVYPLLERLSHLGELLTVERYALHVYLKARKLHIRKDSCKRQLYIVK